MTDVITGMGQVGSTLYRLFESKKIKCSGFDTIPSRCRNWPVHKANILHIACPYFDGFEQYVLDWIQSINPKYTMIHSTIPIGTTKKIQEETDTIIIFAPARGRHDTFLDDMMSYTKFYGYFGKPDDAIRDVMSERFNSFQKAESPTALEISKIMCDTTYLGLLVAYRKYVDSMAESHNVKDKDRMWQFAREAHERYGNRPIMYNDGKKIGGHCVMENLQLLEADEVASFITKWGGHDT